MVSLQKQEKGNTKAISKLMFGIKETGNFLCEILFIYFFLLNFNANSLAHWVGGGGGMKKVKQV